MNETSMSGYGEADSGGFEAGSQIKISDSENLGKQFSEEKIREFENFANTGNVYEKLIQSFAPSIWELDDVKRGVLCQLFGGTIESVR